MGSEGIRRRKKVRHIHEGPLGTTPWRHRSLSELVKPIAIVEAAEAIADSVRRDERNAERFEGHRVGHRSRLLNWIKRREGFHPLHACDVLS